MDSFQKFREKNGRWVGGLGAALALALDVVEGTLGGLSGPGRESRKAWISFMVGG